MQAVSVEAANAVINAQRAANAARNNSFFVEEPSPTKAVQVSKSGGDVYSYAYNLLNRWGEREDVKTRSEKDIKVAVDCLYDTVKYDNISKAVREIACKQDPVKLARSLILLPKNIEEMTADSVKIVKEVQGMQSTLSSIHKEVEQIKELKAAEFAQNNDGKVLETVETKMTTHQKAQLAMLVLVLLAILVFGILNLVKK